MTTSTTTTTTTSSYSIVQIAKINARSIDCDIRGTIVMQHGAGVLLVTDIGIMLHNMETGRLEPVAGTHRGVHAILSPDEQWLFIYDDRKNAIGRNAVALRKEVAISEPLGKHGICCFALDSIGARLFGGTEYEAHVLLFDSTSLKVIKRAPLVSAWFASVVHLAVSNDDKRLVAVGTPNRVGAERKSLCHCFDIDLNVQWSKELPCVYQTCCISMDAKTLVLGGQSEDSAVLLLSMADGSTLSSFGVENLFNIACVHFISPQHVVVSGCYRPISIIDLECQKKVAEAVDGAGMHISLSPCKTRLAASTPDSVCGFGNTATVFSIINHDSD